VLDVPGDLPDRRGRDGRELRADRRRGSPGLRPHLPEPTDDAGAHRRLRRLTGRRRVLSRGVTIEPERRARREAVTVEHMQSENVQDWQRTRATFSHPRYELPDGRVFDGHDAVMRYWIDGRTVVPDQRNELIELTHPDDDHVQIEFWLRGTPTTTGRPFE